MNSQEPEIRPNQLSGLYDRSFETDLPGRIAHQWGCNGVAETPLATSR
jgi:hypothetical protein